MTSLRTQRLRFTWLLALPFLYFSEFSPRLFLVGLLVSAVGLLLRGFAAGSIHKDQELARGGPYRYVRHPLYIGSYLLGLGFSLAGGRWWFSPVYTALFLWLYLRAVTVENRELEVRFGEEYGRYRREVPGVLPRFGSVPPGHPASPPSPGFRLWLYRRNKEWQAALGFLIGYAVLWVRVNLLG